MSARVVAVLALGLCTWSCMLIPDGPKDERRSVYLLAPELSSPAPTVSCGSIQVSPGTGASGFRTARMAYMRARHKLEYFAYSVWADSPARMLGEAIREHLHESGAFDAVVSTPAAVATDLRLDLSDVKLLQRFAGDGSQIEMSLGARVYASDRPQQLLSERFTVIEPAEANAEGGVRAANVAAGRLINAIREFVESSCSRVEAGEDMSVAD